MDGGFDVSVDQVRQHAVNITRITGQLDQVLVAANAQSVPADAFGIICTEIGIAGWLVSPLHDRGVTAVSNAVARAEEIKKILEAVARSYDGMDVQRANRFAEEGDRL